MRLYLHLHQCGVVTRDRKGVEVTDLGAARALAIHEARIVMCSEMKQGWLCLDCHIEIADPVGAILTTVPFRDAVALAQTC